MLGTRPIDSPFCLHRGAAPRTRVIRRCGFCFAVAPIQRPDTPLTASVIAALIALVLVGLGLMLFAWLLARWIRRTTRPADVVRPKGPLGPSDWEPQPWVPSEEGDAGSSWDEGPDE